jgi:acyl-homoserine-lactone acylase
MVAALERAATTALGRREALEAPWGDAFRLRLDRFDLPCSGGMEQLGVFRAFDFAPDADGRMRAVGGDCFVAAVEFADPIRARVLTTYGNATQPGSPHRGDQLPLAAAQDLRPAWLSRAEVEDALELHEWVPAD